MEEIRERENITIEEVKAKYPDVEYPDLEFDLSSEKDFYDKILILADAVCKLHR